MKTDASLADLRKRIDSLEQKLADKEAQIGRAGAVPAHHRAHIDEIQAKASAMRARLAGHDDSQWDAVKHELAADVDALSHVLDRWSRHVDEEFKRRG